ncbi:autotransporter outer membrane beta-barrel domain-containing protein [uncultured Gilliamella sp.]|uniref:autotransporter outer membrane beta-barrel domain-containing protein n=1 Tax=uncultured Gilliamella sp. TaxID=1193505 RepID=UPI0025CEBCE0|nr:autotransporter outer membrane beta-barrel domain-containing protein [uncultured Gilliamella sp.]
MKKLKLNKITLLVSVSSTALSLFPLSANALSIDHTNITNYLNSGISTDREQDSIDIDTSSAAGPHIIKDSGKALEANNDQSIFIYGDNSFDIQSHSNGNYNSFNGVNVRNGGRFYFHTDLNIAQDAGTGIYIASEGRVLSYNKINIDSTSSNSNAFIGIRMYNSSDQSHSEGEFHNKVNINSAGQNSYAIYSLKSNNPNAVRTYLKFRDHVSINMTGQQSHGIAFNQQSINSVNPDPIENNFMEFGNGVDLMIANGIPIDMQQLNGSLNIYTSDDVKNRIVSKSNQEFNAIQSLGGEIDIAGQTLIEGDIYAKKDRMGDALINFVLYDGSYLLTSMDNNNQYANNKGEINLILRGNQSQWKMTNNSYLDHLTLDQGAKVSFGYSYTTPNMPLTLDSHNKMELIAQSLDGEGLFEMRTGIGQTLAGDLLKITGVRQAWGDHKIALIDNKTGANRVNGTEKITLVETQGGNANFAMASSFDIGPYLFNTLTKVSGERDTTSEDWVLSAISNPNVVNDDNSDDDDNNNGNTDDNNGNTDDNNGNTDGNNGNTDDNNGNTDDNNGNTDDNNGNTDDSNGNTDGNNGNTDGNNGNNDSNNGNTDGNNGNTDGNNGNTDGNNGNTDGNNGNTDGNNGNTDGNNGNNNDTGKDKTKPTLTNTAKNAANILNSNYLMNYVETQTLLQRMGQLRTNNGDGGDVWGRIYTGKLSSFNDNRLSNFDMRYYGLQLGVDRKVDNDNLDIYYGIMGGFTRGNTDNHVGDGHTKSYSVALYTSLQAHNGLYFDALVKYMHMSHKFNTKTGGGYAVKGDGDTKGFSIGAEIGKRFYINQWYIEPQMQLTYSQQNSATIKASNGLKTKLSRYNSLIGRTSAILGYSTQIDDNPIDIYIKTGFLKEFDGETAYTFNHVAKEKYDFGGNWWDNGIGVNMQLNQNHHLYGDAVYSVGNKFDQKQINLGYRYSF